MQAKRTKSDWLQVSEFFSVPIFRSCLHSLAKSPTWRNLFSPLLLKMTSVFFSQMGNVISRSYCKKNVDQNFEIYLLPRKIGFQKLTFSQASQKKPAWPSSTPLNQNHSDFAQIQKDCSQDLHTAIWSGFWYVFPLRRNKVPKSNLWVVGWDF